MAVWGIEEDQIVLTRGRPCALEVIERTLAAHLGAQPERLRGCARSPASPPRRVDERRLRGAPRQRLDRQRAGAREQVEHARIRRRRPRIENSASRTRSDGRVAPPPAAAQAASRPAIEPAITRNRSRPDRCRASAPYAERRAPRRAARARAAQAPDHRPRSARRTPAPARAARRLGQLGHAVLRDPVLARADQLALAAQLEVDLGEPNPSASDASARSRAESLARTAGTARRGLPRPIRPRSWCSCEIP